MQENVSDRGILGHENAQCTEPTFYNIKIIQTTKTKVVYHLETVSKSYQN